MQNDSEITSKRKKEHIDLCLNDDVAFQRKTTGFELYDFKHYALTEVDIEKINLNTKFLKKKISYPFLISCMTGGTEKAENLNAQLAMVAQELNIPIGVGSQRQALESNDLKNTYQSIRLNAPSVPVLSNIGAAEVVKYKDISHFKKIVEMISADALVIHLNPLQELLQPEGNINFKGLLKKIKKLCRELEVPVIAKEVGAGISKETALKLLNAGVTCIDVSGAGGTSWAGIELMRSKNNDGKIFWDWGLPTSFCVREVSTLKRKFKFTLIASGGINSGEEIAKSLALGADMAASARIILQTIDKSGVDGTIKLITEWFETVKQIMFLTGSHSIQELRKNKLIKKEQLY